MSIKEIFKKYRILIILIVIGFFFRIYFLGYQSFWMDESYTINAAQGILKHGYPLMDSGVLYGTYFLNTYLTALFIGLFGLSEFSTRLISVIFGCLMIPLIYFVGKEFGNKKIGLISAALVAFSVWEIVWSRQARMYMQLQFFYFLSLLFFYRFIQNKNKKNLFLLLLFTFFAVLSHSFGYVLLVVYFVYLIIIYFKKIINIKGLIQFKKYISKQIIILLVILIGFLAYYLPKIIRSVLTTRVTEKMDYFHKYLSYLTDVHSIIFYFAVIGVVLTLKDFKRKSLLILAYIIPFYFISNHVYVIHYRYLFFILPILFFFSCYSFLYLIDLSKYLKYKKVISIIIALILIFFVFNSNELIYKPQKEYNLELETPQPDFKNAFEYVKENIASDELIITPYTSLARIYLGRVDYSIDYNPTGIQFGSITYVNTTYDVYTNVTTILNLTMLEELTFDNSGYIIVDKFSLRRMNQNLSAKIQNLTLVKDIDKDIYSGIKVYRFT